MVWRVSPGHMAAALTRMDAEQTGVADEGEELPPTVYRLYPHSRLLSERFRDAARGTRRRQIWALPPRYGKSILASQWGPAWYLEWYPTGKVILASYGHDLALHNARQTRNILTNYRAQLSTQLSQDATAADQWNTDKGGGLKAAGVGGAITGFGADLLIIDDPLKDWEEAQSENQREKVWNWYRSVARTRLHKGGSIIVLATRWHLDDLSGRLLAEDEKRVAEGRPPIWDYVRLPTIADGEERGQPDPLGREDGEVLCEDLFPIYEVMEQREELGSVIFGAMHQQDPTEAAGNIIKREWLMRYDAPPEYQELSNWAMSVDCSFADSKDADYVVIQVWAQGEFGHYLIDQVRDRMSYPDTKDAIFRIWSKWPLVNRVLVEDKANGPAVIAEMGKDIRGLVPITPRGSKEQRVHSITPMLRTGDVWIPTAALRPWADAMVDELCAFPYGLHDDQVDALTQHLLWSEHGGPMGTRRSSYPWSITIR